MRVRFRDSAFYLVEVYRLDLNSLILICCASLCSSSLLAQSTQSLTLLGRANLAYRSTRSLSGNDAGLQVFDEGDKVAVLPGLELRYARSLGGRHGLCTGVRVTLHRRRLVLPLA